MRREESVKGGKNGLEGNRDEGVKGCEEGKYVLGVNKKE